VPRCVPNPSHRGFLFEGWTITTLEQQTQDQLQRFFRWQGKDGTFTFSAKWLRDDIGRNSTKIVQSFVNDKLLTLVEAEHFNPDTPGKGRCRRYRLTKKASRRSIKILKQQDSDYLRTRNRTNLTGVGYLTETNGRTYTDFNNLPSAIRSQTTLDNEQLVEIDISNCHFLPVVPLLKQLKLNQNEKDLCDSILTGTFYDELAEITRYDRKTIIKTVLLKVLNSPYNRISFATWNDGLGVSYYETQTAIDQADFHRFFKRTFPRVYKQLRYLGKSKSGYLLGVGYEEQIRRQVQKRFLKKFGYQPLDVHDGFYVKESDYHRFMSVLYKVAGDIPVEVSRSCAGTDNILKIKGLISRLYVHSYGELVEINPRAQQFFIYDDSG